MTKEQIATARQLASDMGFEPSHLEMNRVGEIMDRLLDEREALLEALKDAAGYCAVALHGQDPETHVCDACRRYRPVIAKAEAE